MHESFEKKLQQLADRATQFILLGFFWFITSLGIFTIGASTCALNGAMESYLYQEDQHPLKTFFAIFKEYFRTATYVWLLHLVFVAALGWDLIYYRTGQSTMDILGAVAVAVLLTMVLFELTMIFICMPHYQIHTVKEALKRSFDVTFTCMLESFTVLVLNVALPAALVYLLHGTILFVAGLSAFLSWQILPKMFMKYKYKKGTIEEKKKENEKTKREISKK